MPSKPIELSPAVAKAYMRAFFAKKDGIKADGIAARRLHALKQHYSDKLKLHDVKSLFHQMKDHL